MTTTTETTIDPARRPARRRLVPRRPAWLASLRVRMLVRYALLLALATVASILVARQLFLVQLDRRLDDALAQEVQELERFAGRSPARTSDEPAGAATRRILRQFLTRNVPSRGEAFLTFVDGVPFLRSRQVVPYRLDTDPDLVRRWVSLRAADRGQADTPGGTVEYLAVPLRADGATQGVFVVASFRQFETEQLDDLTTALGAVGLVVLALGTLLFWRGAQRVIAPVRDVTRTARQISESDLRRRIPAQGDSEVAELARTFNEMLDRLEGAFATQRRFLDDASHELRTPITIVRGHLELLEDDPEERRETIALVTDELDRMTRLVDDVLTLAKAERTDFLALETVDVATLTQEVAAKAAALAARDWRTAGLGRGVIVADRQRLTQAVLQLAQNAVQHTATGAPIVIGSRVDGDVARFTVSDSGPGVPREDRQRVFDRFARGAGGRRGGSGLGLAIVRAIAEAHGGRVSVGSAPEGGAEFRLEVPVDPPQAAPVDPPDTR